MQHGENRSPLQGLRGGRGAVRDGTAAARRPPLATPLQSTSDDARASYLTILIPYNNILSCRTLNIISVTVHSYLLFDL